MRSSSRLALLFLAACGGSTSSSVANDDRVPASPTPLPDDRASTGSHGPTGYVTMISVDDTFVVNARFVEDGTRPTIVGGSTCSLGGIATDERPPELSAGTVTVVAPTREGDEKVSVFFDPGEQRYEFTYREGLRVEPGGMLRISAPGDEAPSFDAALRATANVVFDVPDAITVDAAAPADIPITWTAAGGGAGEEVMVDLSLGDASVTCFFDVAAGRGTVPKALVALAVDKAPRECTRPDCMLWLSSKRTETVANGEWSLVLAQGFATIRGVTVAR